MKVLRGIEDFSGRERVFIYGSGGMGRELLRDLVQVGAFCRFIDSFRDGEVDGVPVLRLECYLACRKLDDLIVIASEQKKEIAQNLENAGIFDYYGVDRLPF